MLLPTSTIATSMKDLQCCVTSIAILFSVDQAAIEDVCCLRCVFLYREGLSSCCRHNLVVIVADVGAGVADGCGRGHGSRCW